MSWNKLLSSLSWFSVRYFVTTELNLGCQCIHLVTIISWKRQIYGTKEQIICPYSRKWGSRWAIEYAGETEGAWFANGYITAGILQNSCNYTEERNLTVCLRMDGWEDSSAGKVLALQAQGLKLIPRIYVKWHSFVIPALKEPWGSLTLGLSESVEFQANEKSCL